MPDTIGDKFICEFPEEWENFEKRHRLFFERGPTPIMALNSGFVRRATLLAHVDKFFLRTPLLRGFL